MDERIIVYGVSEEVFPTEQDLFDFLSTDLFDDNKGRFRYTQRKSADKIVISRKGLSYGHLVVEEESDPTDEDIEDFPLAKYTYLVSQSAVYENPVSLRDLGIEGISFGKSITKEQFEEIQKRAGQITHTRRSSSLAVE